MDARIAGIAGGLSWGRLRKIVDAEILAADPPKAMDDADGRRRGGGVRRPGSRATATRR